MKQSIFYKSSRVLLVASVATLVPLTTALAQDRYDPVDQPSYGEPSSVPGTIPGDQANPAQTTTTTPSYENATPTPRGAQGPTATDYSSTQSVSRFGRRTREDMEMDRMRPTDRYAAGMPEYLRQLSKVFRSD